jgi:hypothetical protein
LRLDAFDLSPAKPRLGDTLEVGANLTNIGTGTWVEVPVDISLDGMPVLHRRLELFKGQSGRVNASLSTEGLAERDHTLRLKALNLDTDLNFTLVFPKPDLVAQEMTWVPVLPAVGDTVTFTVKAANLGELPSPQCNLGIFATGPSSMQVATARLPEIQPGRFFWQNLSWNTSGIAPGSHLVRALVDPESAVAEDNRSNNALDRYLEFTGVVDLALGNLSIAPAAPKQGDTVAFSVRALNLGTLRIGYSNITLRVDGRIVDREPLGALSPGGSLYSTQYWNSTGFAPGSCCYELLAEVGEAPGDLYPANNRIQGALPLLPPPGRPDLLVNSIGAPVGAVRAGDLLAFAVIVENAGDLDANACSMGVSLETASGGSFRFTPVPVPAVPAGGSLQVNVSVSTSMLVAGRYSINITLDYQNAVPESNEANNRATRELTLLEVAVAPPELRVSYIRIDGTVEDGKTVTIHAIVINHGDTDATGVYVEFIIDGKVKGTRTLDLVGRNGYSTSSLEWTATAGQHTVKVAVSTNAGYGVAGQLPITVPDATSDSAHQTGAVVMGATIMLMVLAAIVLMVRRPGKQKPADRSVGEEG